jgi:hypothetical protein
VAQFLASSHPLEFNLSFIKEILTIYEFMGEIYLFPYLIIIIIIFAVLGIELGLLSHAPALLFVFCF